FLESKRTGKVALRIEVDQQDTAAAECESRAEVGGGGSFTDPAFLIGNGDNGRHLSQVRFSRRGGILTRLFGYRPPLDRIRVGTVPPGHAGWYNTPAVPSPPDEPIAVCPGCGGKNPGGSTECDWCGRPFLSPRGRLRLTIWQIFSSVLLLGLIGAIAA